MYLIFDTETTGIQRNKNAALSDSSWPRVVQIAWQLHNQWGEMMEQRSFLIKPEGFSIPYDAEVVHGISTALAQAEGKPLEWVVEQFNHALSKAKYVVGQNIDFDLSIMAAEYYKLGIQNPLALLPAIDTCTDYTAELCQLEGGIGGKKKKPKLSELHQHLFGVGFEQAHNATADVEATARCFFELIRIGQGLEPSVIPTEYTNEFRKLHPQPIGTYGIKHTNLKEASAQIARTQTAAKGQVLSQEDNLRLQKATFAHLHCHSQFSVLQSTASITDLIQAAAKEGQPAVALTDLANMMGAFLFVKEIGAYNKKVKAKNQEAIEKGEEPTAQPLKGIVGCEIYICENRLDRSHKDNGYQMVLLAKNMNGYQNLTKLVSYAHTEGSYYVPRIDRELLLRYKDDLIVLSGGLQGELYGKYLGVGETQAKEALLWWKEHFGEDFYIEIVQHGQENELRANGFLIEQARECGVKLIATNNTFYIHQTDANAHDILLCVKESAKQATPIGQGRGFRYGMPNQEYYFKSTAQMKEIFKDCPSAIWNIQELIDKVEPFELSRDVLLPKFDIPNEFQTTDDPSGKKGENNYLKYLTFQGAQRRYGETLTPEIEERLLFELSIIEKTGYPGYFLIVQDFIAAARSMGVSVGPGRGSAAGSAVAYCLGITNIDPITYDLLFERFLNPDRVSMPDIDIDFEDDGRDKVMDYVINKYGANQVAQIITYGTMAAKSSVKDAGRVLDLSLHETEHLTKLIPNMKLQKIFTASEDTLREKLRPEELEKVRQLISISKGNDLAAEVLQQAQILEGSIRNTGIHACGVIITPDDITNFVPITTSKEGQLWVTQFDNSVAESAGLLKMDFLGLKTLTLIKDSIALIEERHGISIDPDLIPLDDAKTYELFQRGETVGIFQYESVGMQKYMRELRPTVFADLIAMNALYRPGPLEYIPSFIRRKHGYEPIVYDLPAMEEYLQETYGITVYQEQVMLLSQKLAAFTKGEADMLRKAMGKKQKDVLDKMKPKFVQQAQERGHDPEKLEKIWKDWEAFASYAFNKSHSTCYAWVGYQTAYLKANYPAEYMAAVLSNNMNDIKSVTFFMEECKRMGIKVLSPDINESTYKFRVNKAGHIRFGLGAIKGIGKAVVDNIVQMREAGHYQSVFDLVRRIDPRSLNKKTMESLVLAGCFDSFDGTHRALFFHQEQGENTTFMEKVIRYGAKSQESKNSKQLSLFGDSPEVQIPEPKLPNTPTWNMMERLRREKEVVGIYISGHPLDDFKYPMAYFLNKNISEIADIASINGEICFGGMLTRVEHRTSVEGRGFAKCMIEDYSGQTELGFYREEYEKLRPKLIEGTMVYIKATPKAAFEKNGRTYPKKLQYTKIGYLSDLLAEVKQINIWLPIEQISPQKQAFFADFLQKYKGDVQVSYEIHSSEQELSLTMEAKEQRISIEPSSIEELEAQGFIYRINNSHKWHNLPQETTAEEEESTIQEASLTE